MASPRDIRGRYRRLRRRRRRLPPALVENARAARRAAAARRAEAPGPDRDLAAVPRPDSLAAPPAPAEDLSELTKAEIMARLDALGVEYQPRLLKGELLGLLQGELTHGHSG